MQIRTDLAMESRENAGSMSGVRCRRFLHDGIEETQQITDTGIRPGSGVGNHRIGLNRETLGVPVIAVGVPMVVYASVIARDALSLLLKTQGEAEEHEEAMDALIDRVVESEMGELVVTPREVDELLNKVAAVIAEALNIALQPRLNADEIAAIAHDGI